jgi:hypothetical protein
VLIWQCVAIKDIPSDIFKSTPYHKIALATVCGSLAAVWVKDMGVGVFLTLVISAILFFGVYGIVVTVAKDPLVRDLEGQLLDKIKKK